MATVDLDELAKALRGEMLLVTSMKRGDELEWIACGGIIVYPNGRIEFQKQGVNPHDVTAVIRHMSTLAPVAPDPGLREAIAKAIWDADMGYATSIAWPPLSSFRKGKTERVADAVLSVLAERGVR